jgi:hypothetical protein
MGKIIYFLYYSWLRPEIAFTKYGILLNVRVLDQDFTVFYFFCTGSLLHLILKIHSIRASLTYVYTLLSSFTHTSDTKQKGYLCLYVH